MESPLNLIEVRVLGCLLEKEVTTPEYYPLTLNALLAACNQKSNRDPVMDLEEREVFRAVETLREKHLVVRVDLAGSRVPKFRHVLDKLVECSAAEQALLCLLLLRGPQTIGELRGRSERLYPFPLLEDVQKTLQEMETGHDFPLVQVLPRQAGRKENRYLHRLAGDAEWEETEAPARPVSGLEIELANERQAKEALAEEVTLLRETCRQLNDRVEILEKQFAEFAAQFE